MVKYTISQSSRTHFVKYNTNAAFKESVKYVILVIFAESSKENEYSLKTTVLGTLKKL